MRSSPVSAGQSGVASQYNDLRHDAYGGSMLLAHEQGTPNMTLYVEPGVYYIGTTRVIFGGGNSPTFTAPTTNPRIDILTADSSGNLTITQGTEASSPTAPAYPTNKVVICEVYHVVGETAIYDNDAQVSGQGYIVNDVRPLAAPPYISSTSQFGSAVVPDSALVSTFIHDPGSDAQGDIIYFNGSAWVRLPAGTSGNVLQTNGSGQDPAWANPFANSGMAGAFSSNFSVVCLYLDAVQVNTTSGSPTKVHEIQFPSAMATMTFTVGTRLVNANGGTYTSYCQIYKNGSAVGTLHSVTSTTAANFTDSVSVSAGDLLQVYAYSSNGSSNAGVQEFNVQLLPIPTSFIPTRNS